MCVYWVLCTCMCSVYSVYYTVYNYMHVCASCDKINSDQHGKMNIFTCSQAIPQPYQLSNGIFAPINIENGHDCLCALFLRLHHFAAHRHIHIRAVCDRNSASSALECHKYKFNVYFVEVWKVDGANTTVSKHTEKCH